MTSPFGIEFHQSLSAKILDEPRPNFFYVSPPKPHPGFFQYIAQTSEKFGVVWVKALGPEIANDSYGSELRTAIEKLSSQLELKYGLPEKTDLLLTGSIWTEPREWLTSLEQKERLFFHIWKSDAGAQLPPDLESIYIGVVPLGLDTAQICIEYSSTNLAAAEFEADEQLSDLL